MDDIIVELSVHRFGDVRCNYTEECYLKFQEDFEFYEALGEANKGLLITKDNKQYNIYINIFDECPDIEICDINDLDDYEYIYGGKAYELFEELLKGKINATTSVEAVEEEIKRLEEILETPISIVSVGPDREQTIFKK